MSEYMDEQLQDLGKFLDKSNKSLTSIKTLRIIRLIASFLTWIIVVLGYFADLKNWFWLLVIVVIVAIQADTFRAILLERLNQRIQDF